MKDSIVTEILNKHAEALNAGRDSGAELLAAHPGRDEMAGLFNVAGRLKATLKPVAPRAEFVADLKQRLVRESRMLQQQDEQRQNFAWLAVGIGSVLYSIGLFAIGMRTTWWLLGLAALAFGWRKRTALIKAPQTVKR